eukprot:TRINITY_DN4360_c0_g1_i1.p1 TRINITY_DN4360_c0_g1~~TRINITY_DN4360_c0_g1_i1.p1  ORF type:complete len:882 (+),score=255.55 TRINITY_DN4360_c0_g1_i1:70-2715(+)
MECSTGPQELYEEAVAQLCLGNVARARISAEAGSARDDPACTVLLAFLFHRVFPANRNKVHRLLQEAYANGGRDPRAAALLALYFAPGCSYGFVTEINDAARSLIYAEEAVEGLREIIKVQEDGFLLYLLGEALIIRCEHEELEKVAQRGLEKFGMEECRLQLARLYLLDLPGMAGKEALYDGEKANALLREGIERDHADSMWMYAHRKAEDFRNLADVNVDPMPLYLRAARLGNFYAVQELGDLYAGHPDCARMGFKEPVEEDAQRAYEYFQRAIELGYAEGYCGIARLYVDGKLPCVSDRFEEARSWVKKALDCGNVYAYYSMARTFEAELDEKAERAESEVDETCPEYVELMQWMVKGAEFDSECCEWLAKAFMKKEQYDKAKMWLERGAHVLQYDVCHCMLSELLLSGNVAGGKDVAQAEKLLREAADQPDFYAKVELAEFLFREREFHAEAVEWANKSLAVAQSPQAHLLLGDICACADSGFQDSLDAKGHYLMAVALNDGAEGHARIAELYHDGNTVEEDMNIAMAHARLALMEDPYNTRALVVCGRILWDGMNAEDAVVVQDDEHTEDCFGAVQESFENLEEGYENDHKALAFFEAAKLLGSETGEIFWIAMQLRDSQVTLKSTNVIQAAKKIAEQSGEYQAYMLYALGMLSINGVSCTSDTNETVDRDEHKAIEYWNRAIQVDPEYAEPHDQLGLLYHERGAMKRAVSHLRRALELGAPWNAMLLANILENGMGGVVRDVDAAIDIYIRLSPDDDDAKEALVKYYADCRVLWTPERHHAFPGVLRRAVETMFVLRSIEGCALSVVPTELMVLLTQTIVGRWKLEPKKKKARSITCSSCSQELALSAFSRSQRAKLKKKKSHQIRCLQCIAHPQ